MDVDPSSADEIDLLGHAAGLMGVRDALRRRLGPANPWCLEDVLVNRAVVHPGLGSTRR